MQLVGQVGLDQDKPLTALDRGVSDRASLTGLDVLALQTEGLLQELERGLDGQ